jgi:hypothetical protein
MGRRSQMIKLLFEKNGKYFSFVISDRSITGILNGYSLPYQPPNLTEVNRKILLSRNKLPAWFGDLFRITNEEMAEFNAAKSDEELKEIIIRDCKKYGCKYQNER